MPIERADVRVVRKPWGRGDLKPWSRVDGRHDAVGELWFARAAQDAPVPALLLKLLFTSAPLSIQVHPGNEFARGMGLPNGKSEAWYIVSAIPGAQVGVGLKRRVTSEELRAAIRDGSIVELIAWRAVARGDVVFIPAGTIHAIGAGIVLAEIQQNSDATFRLFDYGRRRELHEDSGIAAAEAGPLQSQPDPIQLGAERSVLVASPHFVLERVDLADTARWALRADQETWMLVLDGDATVGPTPLSVGQAIFAADSRCDIDVGAHGLTALVAYAAPAPIDGLLERRPPRGASMPERTGFAPVPA